MIAEALSRRYSRALFRVAKKRDIVEGIYEDLKFFSDYMKKDEKFSYFYLSPRIDISEKKVSLNKLFKEKFHNEFLNFLFILLDKKRQTLIERLEREYKKLLDSFHRRSVITVITSYQLDDSEIESMKKSLRGRLKGDVELQNRVDPDIIGGLILRMQNKVFDASLQGQISRMRKKLLK